MHAKVSYYPQAYHPVSTLSRLIALDIILNLLRRGIVLRLNAICQLGKLVDRGRLNKFFIVKVIKQNVQPLFSILDLSRKGSWRLGRNTLHVLRQHIYQMLGISWDV